MVITTVPARIQGRRRPNREVVRSESWPNSTLPITANRAPKPAITPTAEVLFRERDDRLHFQADSDDRRSQQSDEEDQLSEDQSADELRPDLLGGLLEPVVLVRILHVQGGLGVLGWW